MEIITITNQKGGAGKTSTAEALLAGLTKKGYKALALDLDPQCNLSYSLKADTSKPSILGLFTQEVKAKEAIQKTASGDLIQGSATLAIIDTIFEKMEVYAGRNKILKAMLKPITSEYDFIIIDTPPALNILTINALVASTQVIIPAEACIYSLQGIEALGKTITTIQKGNEITEAVNPNLRIAGILLTKYNDRAILNRDIAELTENHAKALNTKLFKATIREAIAVKEAHITRKNIFDYAPKSKVAGDYNNFINELMGE